MIRQSNQCKVINLDVYFTQHPERKMRSFGQQTPAPRSAAPKFQALPLGWRLALSWLAILAACWGLVVVLLAIGGAL